MKAHHFVPQDQCELQGQLSQATGVRKRRGKIAFSNATSSDFPTKFQFVLGAFAIETSSCSKLSGRAVSNDLFAPPEIQPNFLHSLFSGITSENQKKLV